MFPQQENVFHHYSVGIHIATVTCCISFLLVDSKYTGKLITSYGSFLTHNAFSSDDFRKRMSIFYINTIEKSIREDMSYTACPEYGTTYFKRISYPKIKLYLKYMGFSTTYQSLP